VVRLLVPDTGKEVSRLTAPETIRLIPQLPRAQPCEPDRSPARSRKNVGGNFLWGPPKLNQFFSRFREPFDPKNSHCVIQGLPVELDGVSGTPNCSYIFVVKYGYRHIQPPLA
jgi:hypothetical protein